MLSGTRLPVKSGRHARIQAARTFRHRLA